MTKRQDPSVIVGAFIFNDKGELFLTKSSKKWNGKHLIPGGHVEYKEKVIDALERETKEETNLDIKNIKFLGFTDMINLQDFHDKTRHFVALDFKCEVKNENVILNEEAEEYLWINLKDSLELDLVPSTKSRIESLILNKK